MAPGWRAQGRRPGLGLDRRGAEGLLGERGRYPGGPGQAGDCGGLVSQLLADVAEHAIVAWFAKLVAYGELLIGIALIIGAFTGIAALFGGVMNWNYIMAGSASTAAIMGFHFAGWSSCTSLVTRVSMADRSIDLGTTNSLVAV